MLVLLHSVSAVDSGGGGVNVHGCRVLADCRYLIVSGCLSLCCPLLATLPDVAVFKERLRILTVGGTRNNRAVVSLRCAVKPVVHL